LRKFIRIVIARMLNNSFAHFKGEIQSTKCRVSQLKILNNTQRVQVVIKEKPMPAHGGIERFFSGVTKRRMPDIMRESQGLDQIHVEPKLRRDGTRNLRHLDSVG